MQDNDLDDKAAVARFFLKQDRDYRLWWKLQWINNPLNIIERPPIPGYPIILDVFTPQGRLAVVIEFDSKEEHLDQTS